MPLSGQAKTDYQREYMRKRRSNVTTDIVRPYQLDSVRPSVRPDIRPDVAPSIGSCVAHLGERCSCNRCEMDKEYDKPESQSYNPMMVGYVPPTD